MSNVNAGDVATISGMCEAEDGTRVRVLAVTGNEATVARVDGAPFAVPGDEAAEIDVPTAALRYLPQASGVAQSRSDREQRRLDAYEL